MSIKPYWLTPAPLAGTTHVIEQRRDGDEWRVRLAGSLFYPESGGQRSDQGWLGPRRVLAVQIEDGQAWHLLDGEAPAGELGQQVDAERRRDHSEQHSGQHLLSAVCRELLGAETLAFHMGEASSTVELSLSEMSELDRQRIEARCAELIAEDRPLDILYPSPDQAARLPLRKAAEAREGLRIVSIRDYDASPCGGTHVASTGTIGAVFLGGSEKIRGRVRVEYVAGLRALAAASRAMAVLRRGGRSLSCGAEELPERIDAVLAQLRDASRAVRELRERLLVHESLELKQAGEWVALSGGRFLAREFPGRSLPDLVDLGNRLCEEAGRVFLGSCPDGALLRLHLQRSRGEGPHLGEMLKAALAAAGGKGGGSADRAQGVLEDPAGWAALTEEIRRRLSA